MVTVSSVLFARDGPTIQLGVLVKRPLTSREQLKNSDHFHGKKFHKAALEAAEAFTAVIKNPDLAIDHRLSSERSVWSFQTLIHCRNCTVLWTAGASLWGAL